MFTKIICLDVVQYFTSNKQFEKLFSEIYRMLQHNGMALIGGIRIKINRKDENNKNFDRSIRNIIGKELAYYYIVLTAKDYINTVIKKNKFKESQLYESNYYPGFTAFNLLLKK